MPPKSELKHTTTTTATITGFDLINITHSEYKRREEKRGRGKLYATLSNKHLIIIIVIINATFNANCVRLNGPVIK